MILHPHDHDHHAPLVTPDELADAGLTPADVCRLWPHAVEYTALDGTLCYLADDLDGRASDA